jgi:hypothetical protein
MKWWLVAAVGWATGIMGAFFILRFVQPPFSEWSHGDQAQLLQAMTALAGFGAGLVAVVSAVVQLERLTARPKLKVSVTQKQVDRTLGDGARAILTLEIENVGDGVCRDWQVALWTTADYALAVDQDGWQQLSDGTLVYNASGKPLFPRNPCPLPYVVVAVRLPRDEDGPFTWNGEIRYIIATEHTRKRQEVSIPLQLVIPAAEHVEGGPGGGFGPRPASPRRRGGVGGVPREENL